MGIVLIEINVIWYEIAKQSFYFAIFVDFRHKVWHVSKGKLVKYARKICENTQKIATSKMGLGASIKFQQFTVFCFESHK